MKKALIVLSALLLSVSAAAFEAEIPEALTENDVVTDAAALAEEHDLSLDKEVYAPGETITVSYINGTLSGSKWLGIYVAGTALDSNQYKAFAYTTASTGTLTLAAPSAPGMYEMRYFGDSGYGSCYDSVPFTVASPEETHCMTADKQNYFPSETITVEYTNGTAQGTKWIGIYKADAPLNSDAYKAFAWTTAETGTLTFKAPADYGDYELRFFGDSRYSLCFDRVPFSVVHHISLSKDTYFTGETLDVAYDIDFQHWFVITDVGATVDGSNYNNYKFGDTGIKGWSYIYTGSGVNTSVRAPRHAGEYEIHLLYNNEYDKVDSIPLTVIERCSLDSDTYTVGGTVTVAYAGAIQGDWVGIYTPDAADTNGGYSDWTYINPNNDTPSGTVTLPVPTVAGTYEIRVFAEHSTICVERHTFTVTKPSTGIAVLDGAELRVTGKTGLRVGAFISAEERAAASGYGFIVAKAEPFGGDYTDFVLPDGFDAADAILTNAVGTTDSGVKFTAAACYAKDGDTVLLDIGKTAEIGDVDGIRFNGVLVGMTTKTQYTTDFAIRPYIVKNGVTLYGETAVRNLYEVAEALHEAGEDNDYINTILGAE